MSLPRIVVPSPAELLEKIRRKTQQQFMTVLHPAVRDQIEHLKEVKRWQANIRPDEDYKTIIEADITHAIRVGVIVEAEEMITGDCWSAVINGQTGDGIKISISVYLMKDDDDPLIVMSFALLPDETDIGDKGFY